MLKQNCLNCLNSKLEFICCILQCLNQRNSSISLATMATLALRGGLPFQAASKKQGYLKNN